METETSVSTSSTASFSTESSALGSSGSFSSLGPVSADSFDGGSLGSSLDLASTVVETAFDTPAIDESPAVIPGGFIEAFESSSVLDPTSSVPEEPIFEFSPIEFQPIDLNEPPKFASNFSP